MPSDNEIQAILAASKANLDLYIPICLSAFGSLRRSEICALDAEKDITEKGVLIRGARVISDKGKFITKNTTKNVTSRREAYLPAFVISLIKEVGFITKYQPNSLSAEFRKLLERNNIRHMRFHDLSHPYVKHTTKKYNSEKQKTQATKIDLIAWVFRFCTFNYSKRSWTL